MTYAGLYTYRCYSHLINKEVGETSGFANESLLTKEEVTGIIRLVLRL